LRRKLIDYASLPGHPGNWMDPGDFDNYHDAVDVCFINQRNFDMGWGRINPYRSYQQWAKRFPFRNVEEPYSRDFANGPGGWSSIQYSKPSCVQITDKGWAISNKWTYFPSIGWEESDKYKGTCTCSGKNYPSQNPDGLFTGGADIAVMSDVMRFYPNQQYAMGVDHPQVQLRG